MIKPWQSPFILTMAMLCAAGKVAAQKSRSGPDALLPNLNPKRASALAIVRLPPEYPAVARVNLIQGSVELELTVNGQVRQSASTSEMVFPVPAIIAFLSEFVTLQPGDVIATGTPSGKTSRATCRASSRRTCRVRAACGWGWA